MRSTVVTLAFIAAGVFVSAGAQAQSFDTVRLQNVQPGQSAGSLGAGLVFGREFPGSSRSDRGAFPGLDVQWGNGWFAGSSLGVGRNFSHDPTLQYGLRLTYDFGRDQSDSARLRGLGDVPGRIEWGGFANWLASNNFMLSSSVRAGSGQDRDGVLLDLGASYRIPLSSATTLGLSTGLTWTNAAWAQERYGISPAQAAASGYPVYSAGSGLRDIRLGASLSYRFTPQLTLMGGVGLTMLQGDVRTSPIVEDTSWISGVVGVNYRF